MRVVCLGGIAVLHLAGPPEPLRELCNLIETTAPCFPPKRWTLFMPNTFSTKRGSIPIASVYINTHYTQ